MDGNHPNNRTPRPKRRRAADNPYEIYTVGTTTDCLRYYISFQDGMGTQHELEISKELFDALDRFELDDLSFLNEVDRHYEQSEQSENSLNKRATTPQISVEETVMRQMEKERLHQAISKLPEIQRRRLSMYYFSGLTFEQIAKKEGCTKMSVKFSVDHAIQNIKKIFS